MANQLRGKRVTIEPHLYEPGDGHNGARSCACNWCDFLKRADSALAPTAEAK